MESRDLTNDIDIVVQLCADHVDRLCNAFPAPEFYVSAQAAREAVQSAGTVQCDPSHLWQQNRFHDRARRRLGVQSDDPAIRQPILPDRETFVAAPEDVIIAKLLYYQEGESEKHLRDIASMLRISGDEIDKHISSVGSANSASQKSGRPYSIDWACEMPNMCQ